MKVSLNWLKQFTSVDLPIDELVEKIGAQLGAVEEVVNTGEKYKGLLVVNVVKCQKHPNADKLSLCLIDDGGVTKNIKRTPPVEVTRASTASASERVAEGTVQVGTESEQRSSRTENVPQTGGVDSSAGKQAGRSRGLIQVVCGAPNVKAGMLAAWIPPGATVPSSYDKEPFVIEARPIRNKTSHGMLASAKELDIGDDHSGIVEVDKDAKPGSSFAELYNMSDYIIDIENKMFTHRPDLFGHLGIAREIAGIQRQPFKSPDWYRENAGLPADGRKNVLKLSVKNDAPKLVPRFCAVAIKDVKVGPSPLWLRASLSRLGVNSVNNVVDLTNFYMLVTAQPLHAYDYDKVIGGARGEGLGAILGVRLSKKGEKLALLNGKEITLNEGTTVITDGHKPIGLGGIMGGADTEIDEKTKNIILEAANFDMNQTRKTAMEYGLFTDAATRFTKNQSPRQNLAVLVRAVEDIMRTAGGRVASPIVDDKHFPQKETSVSVTPEFINSRLGLNLTASETKKILEDVEFKVTGNAELKIITPFWRTDIEIPEDIVEEVGRLYGYDKLPLILPKRDLAPAEKNPVLDFKSRLRQILKQAGANEVLTYSFVHGSLMQKVGQDSKEAYHIRNALSPELQYYRLSLTPSLLEKIHPNIRTGLSKFAIFEIGKGHNQKMKDKAGLPIEFEMLSMVVAAKNSSAENDGAPYYQARTILDYLAAELGTKLKYKPIPEEEPYPVTKPFDYTRSAQVWNADSKIPLGMVGEYKQSVIRGLKLPAYCAGFEIGIEQLMQIVPRHKQYQPLTRFPALEQDFNLRTGTKLNYQELSDFINKNLRKLSEPHGYNFQTEALDIFQRADNKSHKQTTWRIILWHPERTLTTDETNKLLDELADKAKKDLKAERV